MTSYYVIKYISIVVMACRFLRRYYLKPVGFLQYDSVTLAWAQLKGQEKFSESIIGMYFEKCTWQSLKGMEGRDMDLLLDSPESLISY